MFKVFLALHLVTAIFVIGPLAQAAAGAVRGVRLADAAALSTSARITRVYSYVSVLVVVFGFALVGVSKAPRKIEFSDTWVWSSLVLWLVAVAVALGVLVPALQKAADQVTAGQDVGALRGRVAATGGVVALVFVAVVVLMVYRPGS